MSKKQPIKVDIISREEGLVIIQNLAAAPNHLGVIIDQDGIREVNKLEQTNLTPEEQQNIIDLIAQNNTIKRPNTRAEKILDKIKNRINTIKRNKKQSLNDQLEQKQIKINQDKNNKISESKKKKENKNGHNKNYKI